jgi:uncharacterized membrane protein
MEVFYALMTIVGIITTAAFFIVLGMWAVGTWFISRSKRIEGKGLKEVP